jgi:hypothetical protein
MIQTTIAKADEKLVDQFDRELTKIAQAQFESPEFKLLFSAPLTMESARFVAIQFVFYNVNRRDGWGFVQARAPWAIKKIVWEHEMDELHHDPRGGADHLVLMTKEALALGASEEEIANAKPTPLLEAAQIAFVHIAMTHPWLGALTAAHFLERRNNSDLMKGGGFSARWKQKVAKELGVDPKSLISSNVHIEADVAHSDSIWEAIAQSVTDEESYNIALRGAEACAVIDRAYRGALAHGIQAIETE